MSQQELFVTDSPQSQSLHLGTTASEGLQAEMKSPWNSLAQSSYGPQQRKTPQSHLMEYTEFQASISEDLWSPVPHSPKTHLERWFSGGPFCLLRPWVLLVATKPPPASSHIRCSPGSASLVIIEF